MIGRFVYLKIGLAAVLVFVGFKMLLTDIYKIPVWMSLVVIATILGVAMVASWRRSPPAAAGTDVLVPTSAATTPEVSDEATSLEAAVEDVASVRGT